MQPSSPTQAGESNHPLALRMGVIAFIQFNITIACVWGSFSVLLSAVESRLGVGRDLSTLAVPMVTLTTALFAPVVGALAARYSLRMVMIVGALLSLAGFLLLALSSSYVLYMIAYGALLGPGMAAGAILPGTLVTRWFLQNRGKALGIACAPVVIALVPLLTTWTLQSYGVAGSYMVLAALSAITVLAAFFVIDQPPGQALESTADQASAAGGLSIASLVGMPRFWALALAYIASVTSSIVITSHMVPMAQTWGFSATLAATLLTVQSLIGIGGTVIFGWIADRIGGALAMALLLFDGAVLWLLLLLHLPFPAVLVIVGLIGLHGAGSIPSIGIALSEGFGRESYSRAFGLLNLVNLPFSVVAVPAAAMVFTKTGSYSGALIGAAAFLGLGAVLAFSVKRKRDQAAS